ncbi:hypothetical protein GCM10009716_23430 [Streptomyces sodiiphilus]|uniref:Uncharacterized protein n=1 Tax=Streptomyces sodiiphilus TaxID=226217 RepID=A0ABN2P6I6_9ACTN
MSSADLPPLPGLEQEPGARGRRVVCRLCGRPLTDREARTWGLGAGCREKLALRTAPRPATPEVEQDALPGV